MVRYGPWQPGLDHIYRIEASNTFQDEGAWEPNPEWPSPFDSPISIDERVPLGSSSNVSALGYPAYGPTELQDRGMIGTASGCAYTHARAPHQMSMVWPPGDLFVCPPLGSSEREWQNAGGSVRVSYQYSSGLFGDAVSWGMSLVQDSIRLNPELRFPSGEIAPWAWPDGAVGVEIEPGPIILEDIVFGPAEWTPTGDDPNVPPDIYVRLWRENEGVEDGWWPSGTAGNNLEPDPGFITEWPRLRQPEWAPGAGITDAVSLRDWVPDIIGDGVTSHLGVTYMMHDWIATGIGGNTASKTVGGTVNLPQWQFYFRSRPYRYVYQGAPPITRVHPRDDGRGTAAAARVYPPPRSQQGGCRVGPGSYY